MRFARLDLLKYGLFDGASLAFPRADVDFHLIFGANEAGKSTTLAAVTDLLFSFPGRTPYSFRFAAPLLRLGASLEHAGQTVDIRRRKGNKDTLLDPDEAPVPDSLLQPFLQGVSPDAFRIGFSLNHRRLEEGGRAILGAKDDVGQALFAAGSGLLGVQATIKDLEAEADAIWGRHRAGRRTYTQAENALSDAQARLKAALVRPKEWIAAKQELEKLSSHQAELQEQNTRERNELSRLQRVRRIAPAVSARAALLETVESLPPSPFDLEHERIYDQAIDAISAAELKRQAALTGAAELTETIDTIVVDDAVLGRREEINALVTLAGAALQGAQHLPLRRAELQTLRASVSSLLRELALDDAPLEDLQNSLPSRIALGDLQRKAAKRSGLETTLETLKEQLGVDEAAAEEADAAVAALPTTVDNDAAEVALREGQRAVAVEARLVERRGLARRLRGALDRALLVLKPWSGDPEALRALRLPADDEIANAETAIQDAIKAVGTETTSLRDLTQALERLDGERLRFAEGSRAVSFDQVVAARSERDESWRPLRDHLVANTPIADPVLAVQAFESTVRSTDRLLDDRFDTAQASARLADFDDRIALAKVDIEHARSRLDEAVGQKDAASAAWDQQLEVCGLSPMTPAAIRQWRTDRSEAIRLAGELLDAEDALTADELVVSAARSLLISALDPTAAAALAEDAPFSRILDAVQSLVTAVNTARSLRARLETEAKSANKAVLEGRRRVGVVSGEIAEWHAGWDTASAAVGLAGAAWDTMGVRAPIFEQLRGAIDAALEMQRRVNGIVADQEAFATQARDLAGPCGEDGTGAPQDITRALRVRLEKASADAGVVGGLQVSLDKELADQREAERVIAAAATQIQPLLDLAGVADRAALARLIEDSRALRQARVDIGAREQTILSEGDGHPLGHLLEEAEAVDPDTVPGETSRTEHRIKALDDEVSSAAQAVGAARQVFQDLDHGDDAALAAADAEQARAAMAAEAEAYLIRRAQAVMLRWGIEKYRQRQQNPLLTRASEFFETLTLGRYTDLQIDFEEDQPRLVGVCADGATTVTVDGMSDGTADQLFLALRLAALEQTLDANIALPFLADDLFINFDDRRAHAGFKVLGQIARKTQVLFFTHHEHLRAIAEDALHPDVVSICGFS